MSKEYSPEFRNRAARMVGDCLADDRSCMRWRASSEIAPRLNTAVESFPRPGIHAPRSNEPP